MQVDSGFRNGGGKSREDEHGAPGTAGKKAVVNGGVFHCFFE